MSAARPTRRVLVIDDSDLQCQYWRHLLEHRYAGLVSVETYTDPVRAVAELRSDIHLVLLDWEMPTMNGEEVLVRARGAGVNLKRVIISSCHSADRLHEVFDRTGCLAVIEKGDPEQQAAFMMILDSIMKR